jgi:phage FluMu gp28-like protein
MTAPAKESLASRILAAFQRGDVSIPHHRPLIDDLHSVQRTLTLSGNVRYAAPREEGSHADRWTAMALALHAAGSAPVRAPLPPVVRRLSRRQQMHMYL